MCVLSGYVFQSVLVCVMLAYVFVLRCICVMSQSSCVCSIWICPPCWVCECMHGCKDGGLSVMSGGIC